MRRILVVEDDPDLLEATCDALRGMNVSVQSAGNGKEALEVLAQHGVDAVLTDVRMPVMSGMELLREIRSTNKQKPFVFIMTGYATVGQEEALREGAAAFYEKPVSLGKFLDDLERLLRKSGGPDLAQAL
jgi:CheY-like chemotaxis protein